MTVAKKTKKPRPAPKPKIPLTPVEEVIDGMRPVTGRFILRRTTDGRTMAMGVLLTDICGDDFDRMWTGSFILMPVQRLRVKSKKMFEGRTIQEVALSHLADQGDSEIWVTEGGPKRLAKRERT